MRPLPLLAIVLSLAASAAGHTADKAVRRIYIREDWAALALPELVAQLEVPAIIELGTLEPAPQPPAEDEYRRRWSDSPIPPDRLVREFAFEAGTAGEALDAFCRLNPNIAWREEQGVIILRRPSGYPDGAGLLDRRIDRIERPLNTARFSAWGVVAKLEKVLPAEQLLHFEPHDRDVWARLWSPRGHSDYPMSLNLRDVTARQVMLHILSGRPDHFWIHAHSAHVNMNPPGVGLMEGHLLTFTNWSAVRRLASAEELMMLVSPAFHGELHGYRNLEVRAEDAQRELLRRAHFEPEAIRAALKMHHYWDMLIEDYFRYFEERALENRWTPLEFEPLVEVMLEVADEAFAEAVLERLTRDDGVPLTRKQQSARSTLLYAMPMPNEKHFELALPYWKKLATDSDEYGRQAASFVLQWHAERQAWLEARKARE